MALKKSRFFNIFITIKIVGVFCFGHSVVYPKHWDRLLIIVYLLWRLKFFRNIGREYRSNVGAYTPIQLAEIHQMEK